MGLPSDSEVVDAQREIDVGLDRLDRGLDGLKMVALDINRELRAQQPELGDLLKSSERAGTGLSRVNRHLTTI